MKVEESLNVTFDETPSLPKTSALEDDDLVEEEAIEVNKTKPLGNDLEDKSLENNEIINIKESKSHPLDNVIGNLNQRTLRSQAQDKINFFCFLSTIELKNVRDAFKDESWQIALAISTTEAEYVSTGKACQQVLWMKQALVDYGIREYTAKGTHDGKKKRDSFYQHKKLGKQGRNQNVFAEMDDGYCQLGRNILKLKRPNHRTKNRNVIKLLKEKEQLQKTVDSWKDSSKNLWRLIDSGMSSNSKVGLGFEIQSNNEIMAREAEVKRVVNYWTNINSVRPKVNAVSPKVNTVRSRQARVLTEDS
ncbi:hypothetical protein Tco_0699743 [Tanacetum coccineum]